MIYHNNEEKNSYNFEINISFDDVYFSVPMIHENNGSTSLMTPHQARLRNLTYSQPIYIDITIKIIENPMEEAKVVNIKKLQKINIGKVPLMIGSKYCVLNNKTINNNEECKYDLGGYFIVNGNEKVIVAQEKIAENIVFVFKSGKSSSKYSHISEVKSVGEEGFYTPKNMSLKLTSKDVGSGRTIRAIHVR